MIVLNDAQRAAVTAGDGPALVLAGAGSGKTRVIIERLAWLIEEEGVDPRHLLALTFTNKAAAEMQKRFLERLNLDRSAAWIGTFHSFGLYVLRREMGALGRSTTFTIFDDADQLGLMKRLVRDLPSRYERVSPREALTWVSLLKQRCGEPGTDEPEDAREESFRALWTQYHDALRRASAVDFDDLLVLVVKLFDTHPEVLSKYQRRCRYVLVDEYQDTNHAQYLVLRALTKDHGHVFVVGDEDQCIYSWRGADINNILDFAKDFPGADAYRLEDNYRSTQPILDAANALAAHNLNRLGKQLRTQRKGVPVRFFLAEGADAESGFVVDDLLARQVPLGTAAVLYRTNAQARVMEEALLRRGLPYLLVGGTKFYSRKESKDILAYLRLLVNEADDESVRRVLNVPPRGIGEKTLESIEQLAAQRQAPLLQVLRDIAQDTAFSPRARQAAETFTQIVDELAVEAKTRGVAALVDTLLTRVGYREYVAQSDEKDFRTRLEMVDEFVAACGQHDSRNTGTTLLEFLQGLSLESDVDRWDPQTPALTLMTCHNAKGLEFDHVYLIGLEEGLLPHFREFGEEDQDIEEERRLCYVAMTRARDTLTLAAARTRTVYGYTHNDRRVSRFIAEIGADRLELVHAAERKRDRDRAPKETPAADAGAFKTGARVHHARFGVGVVMYTQGAGDRLKVHVRFNTGRSATLMASQAPLKLVEERKS